MRPRTLWSLCAAMLAALVAGAWLLPAPTIQARPQRLVIDTPTTVPPSPTFTSVVPSSTATSIAPSSTATSVVPTNTAIPVDVTAIPTGTASSPDATATPLPTRAPAPGSPSLRITKSPSASEGAPGDLLTFSLNVSNDGDGTANDVTISDSLPDFLEIYNVKTTKGIASNQGQRVAVRLDTLEPGESVEVTIVARIRDDAVPQNGSNIGVVEWPDGERTTSERVRVTVLQGATATAATGTPLAGTPTATTVPPMALPVTNANGDDLERLILLFGVGLMILSAGWALLGLRRR